MPVRVAGCCGLLAVVAVCAGAAAGCTDDGETAPLGPSALTWTPTTSAGAPPAAAVLDDTARAALVRRLPDAPSRTLGSTIAHSLAGGPYAEVDGSLAEEPTGFIAPEVVAARFLGGRERLDEVLARLDRFPQPWRIRRMARLEGGLIELQVETFGFLAGGAPPGAAGDALRGRLLSDLEEKASRRARDTRLVRAAIDESGVVPREVTFVIRMGRRKCRLAFDDERERARFVPAAVREGATYDGVDHELILRSGRVCRIEIGNEG